MLGIAGALALLLGIIGIYGVIAYAVSQRRREIGIRLALGAPQSQLKRMFMRYALTLAGIGVAIGLVGAASLTRLMSSLLFGIAPTGSAHVCRRAPGICWPPRLAGQLPAGAAGGRGGPGGNAEGRVAVTPSSSECAAWSAMARAANTTTPVPDAIRVLWLHLPLSLAPE
jgi:ABC-type antimicrobial peptide transport system permease subunit